MIDICMRFSDLLLPSQADRRSDAAEEHDRKSQLSQDTVHGYKMRELDRERRPIIPQRDKTSKEHAEFPTRDANIYSLASELRESYHRGSSDSAEGFHYSTAYMENIHRSDHNLAYYSHESVQRTDDPWSLPSYRSQAGDVERQSFYSQNVTENPRSGVSAQSGRRWTVYDHSASAPRQQQSYRHQARDADDFPASEMTYTASSGALNSVQSNADDFNSDEVQWLDSWNRGSKDIDMRNYRGYHAGHY